MPGAPVETLLPSPRRQLFRGICLLGLGLGLGLALAAGAWSSGAPDASGGDPAAGSARSTAAGAAHAEAADAQAGEAEANGAIASDTTGGPSAEAGDADEADPPPTSAALELKVGVASCDDFATAWRACIEGPTPEEERAALRAELAEQLAAWKQTVDGGGSAAAVEVGCETAAAAAKARSEPWGCELGGS